MSGYWDEEGQPTAETKKALRRAHRIARDGARTFGRGMPDWITWFLQSTALRHESKRGRRGKASLTTVCAELAKSVHRHTTLKDIVKDVLSLRSQEWEPAEDKLDGHRLQLTARLILAAKNDPDAPFQLFSPSRLIAALDEFGSVDAASESVSAFAVVARMLAAGGSRRHLAALPRVEDLRALAEDMPNLAEVVDFYAGQAALLRLNRVNHALFPPVLLLGPHGVGKTYFAQRLAKLIGSPWRVLSLSSASAGWLLTGLSEHWRSSKPGAVFTTLAGSRMANPVLVADELDKASTDDRYAVLGGLYGLWEQDTAREFVDEYVTVPIDASAVIWIATANDASAIPRPLMSRLTVFDIEPPDAAQSRHIVMNLFDRIKGEASFAPLDDEVIDRVSTLAPREMRVRLRRAAGYAALRAVETRDGIATVLPDDLAPGQAACERRVGFL